MQAQNNFVDDQSCRSPAILPLFLQVEIEMNRGVYFVEQPVQRVTLLACTSEQSVGLK
jgi:hypothetical protein